MPRHGSNTSATQPQCSPSTLWAHISVRTSPLALLLLHKEVTTLRVIEESPRLELPNTQVDSHREEMERYPAWVDVHLDKCTSLQVLSPTRGLIARLVNIGAAGCYKRIYLSCQ